MEKLVILRADSESLREQAYLFIEQQMRCSHHVLSREEDIPHNLFVALFEGRIVASLAFEPALGSPSLAFCSYQAEPDDIVLIRWLATKARAGRTLLEHVIHYAIKLKKKQVVCIMKQDIYDYVQAYSRNCWKLLADIRFSSQDIPVEYQEYFFTFPFPNLYLSNLHCLLMALREHPPVFQVSTENT